MDKEPEKLRMELLRLLDDEKFEAAYPVSRQLLSLAPDDAEANMLAGIVLEKQGRIDEATTYLRRATVLGPENPEAFHNLAVALYNQGNKREAETIAEEALKLDPVHEQALSLLKQCRAEKGEVGFEAGAISVNASQETMREGADDEPKFLWNLGLPWTRIGYGLAVYCVFSFIMILVHPFLGVDQKLKADLGAMASFVLYASSGILCGFWMLVDIIDRRERFVWLLPIWVCGFVSLPVLPLTLYLALRKRASYE